MTGGGIEGMTAMIEKGGPPTGTGVWRRVRSEALGSRTNHSFRAGVSAQGARYAIARGSVCSVTNITVDKFNATKYV